MTNIDTIAAGVLSLGICGAILVRILVFPSPARTLDTITAKQTNTRQAHKKHNIPHTNHSWCDLHKRTSATTPQNRIGEIVAAALGLLVLALLLKRDEVTHHIYNKDKSTQGGQHSHKPRSANIYDLPGKAMFGQTYGRRPLYMITIF